MLYPLSYGRVCEVANRTAEARVPGRMASREGGVQTSVKPKAFVSWVSIQFSDVYLAGH